MAFRTDVTVNFQISPRIATVAAPSVEITIQDLHDTLVGLEDSVEGSEYPNLISSAGKEALGGGVTVGITATLQNAKIAFASRVIKLETGTVTTPDATGVTLIDSTALFVTNLVVPGDVIRNHSDAGSVAGVLSVDSEIQITTDGLQGGTDNQFDSADVYDVLDWVQCNVSGGNLVAVDDVGADLDPIFPTFGTQIVRAASSSATLQELGAIQFASFNNGVTVSDEGTAGTAFPIGTVESPANNIPDAMAIAAEHGFFILYVNDVFIFGATDNVDEMIVIGEGIDHTFLTVTSGCSTVGTTFKEMTLNGAFSTTEPMVFEDLIADALTGVAGSFFRVIFRANVTLATVAQSRLINCSSGLVAASSPDFDLGGANPGVVWRSWTGGLTVSNKSGAAGVDIDLTSGDASLTATVTAGVIHLTGIGHLKSDLSVGATVQNELLSAATIWTPALVESYPAGGQSSATPAQMLYSMNQMLSEFARSGTTVSIKKRDGTEAFQLTLDSATAPTSSTQST